MPPPLRQTAEFRRAAEWAKEQGATLLSIESQARSAVYALTAIVTGALADAFGLAGAFALMAVLLGLAVVSDRGGEPAPRSPAP